MDTTLMKTKKALTIALVILQIPMLMLWKITIDFIDIFPFLQTIKYVLLCSVMVLSSALCGLGIADVVKGKNALPVEMEHMDEQVLYQ